VSAPQTLETRQSVPIQRHDLTVYHGQVRFNGLLYFLQLRKPLIQTVSLTGNEVHLTVVEKTERSPPVPFRLKAMLGSENGLAASVGRIGSTDVGIGAAIAAACSRFRVLSAIDMREVFIFSLQLNPSQYAAAVLQRQLLAREQLWLNNTWHFTVTVQFTRILYGVRIAGLYPNGVT
jgi:hypothetical protein